MAAVTGVDDHRLEVTAATDVARAEDGVNELAEVQTGEEHLSIQFQKRIAEDEFDAVDEQFLAANRSLHDDHAGAQPDGIAFGLELFEAVEFLQALRTHVVPALIADNFPACHVRGCGGLALGTTSILAFDLPAFFELGGGLHVSAAFAARYILRGWFLFWLFFLSGSLFRLRLLGLLWFLRLLRLHGSGFFRSGALLGRRSLSRFLFIVGRRFGLGRAGVRFRRLLLLAVLSRFLLFLCSGGFLLLVLLGFVGIRRRIKPDCAQPQAEQA